MSSFPQKSILRLKIKIGISGKNIIEEMFFTPPLKIISPIEDENITDIMLIAVSAGLMKSDFQDIKIHIGKKSKIKLSSQSYEKIHDTQDGYASKKTQIIVEENAFLDYAPLPVIPFANSSFKSNTQIHLHKNSKLHYSEIFCAGRIARNEIFAFKEFASKILIYRENTLVFFENMSFIPKKMDMHNCCLFDTYTHSLSLILFDDTLRIDALEQKILNSKINAGISFNNGAIIIRALANESETLLNFKESLLK